MLASAATIPANDEGLLRGDGIFEVIRVYDGKPFGLEAHLQRLERSALNLRLALDLESVRAEASRLLAHAGSGPDHELLRIVITRGGHRILLTEPLPVARDRVRLGTVIYSPTRVLDGVKSLSYAANMLATRIARERGFDEALLVTPHGHVLEAPTSSLFWITDGEVFTPPLSDHILASITRALVIDTAGASERSCTLEELGQADEAFLASTTREVQPVSQIDNHSFNRAGAVSARVAAAVSERVRSELTSAE